MKSSYKIKRDANGSIRTDLPFAHEIVVQNQEGCKRVNQN
jgi:hypothetical protein